MARYDVYLFLHVGAAVVWVGAAALMCLLGLRVDARAGDERRRVYIRDSEWLGVRLFLPSSLLTLVFGVLLVHEGPWTYGNLWVALGVGALAASTFLGVLVFGPGWARAAKLAESETPGSPALSARLGRLLLAGWLDLGLLLAAVWLMVVKPTSGDTGALVVAGAIPAVAVAVGLVAQRRVVAAAPRAGGSLSPR